jgi:hypothetical protein
MDESPVSPEWSAEALAFLAHLEPLVLAESFLKQDRFGNAEGSWCALKSVDGPLGRCLFYVWTTAPAAMLDPPQVKLWVVRPKPDADADLDKDRVASYTFEGLDELSEHLIYMTACVELAANEEAFARAMRVGSSGDAKERDHRREFLNRLRGGTSTKKGLPS